MNTAIRKYPIGQQDFRYLRENGFIYVDKTQFISSLTTYSKQVFLSRPRRFGKSLFISTLKYYFQGKKELFEGLKIAELEKDWTEHPVFHIEFNLSSYTTLADLESALNKNLTDLEQIWGKSQYDNFGIRFAEVIQRAAQKSGKGVVVLVDEYDKPLLSTMENEEVNKQMRAVLKGFYGVLKVLDEHLRFTFLTGVTKFSKVSIFSDLNQLQDISLHKDFAELCGITETELLENFKPDIANLADKNQMTYQEALSMLKQKYDGYHFHHLAQDVYNPFSLLNVFSSREFGYYWFATGTPTFLVEMAKRVRLDIYKLENDTKIDIFSMMDYRYENLNPVPVMYQSGYLTIKGFDKESERYVLGFPNDEVKYGYLLSLLPIYYTNVEELSEINYNNFVEDLRDEQIDTFMKRLKVYFSGFPYDLFTRTERHYQTTFYILFALMGQRISVEQHYAVGRPDVVLEFKDKVYIFEFKLDGNGTAEEALRQIEEKDYSGKFKLSGKKIFKIGVVFDNSTRTVKEWAVKQG